MIMCTRQRTRDRSEGRDGQLARTMPPVSSRSPCCRGSGLDFHACLTARADELSELTDAVLCADGPVRDLAGLSLAPEHRRGHGALYDAVNHGRVDIGRLRRSLAGLPLPRAADGRLVLAADVSNWLRPGAATSPERLFCHVYGRGKGQAQMIPGWPYSVVAALEPGRTSWTAVLDAVRLGPDDDETEVTAAQVREVVARLIAAGHWREGDPRDPGRLRRRLRRDPAGLAAGGPAGRAARAAAQRPGDAAARAAAPARDERPAPQARRRAGPVRPGRPGRTRRSPRAPRPPGTGPPWRPPGTGCTPG